MFKRIGVVLTAAMLGVAALADPASSQPEARLTLQIDPNEGKVGTPIHATVPEEYKQECLSGNEFVAQVQTLAGQLVGGFSPDVTALLNSIQSAPNLTPEDLNFTILFVLAFADLATQQPVTDETTGQQATSFWDPATGQGTIDAPNVHPRSATYAVAAVCLRLKTLDEINPEDVVQALQGLEPAAGPEAAGQALLLALINQEPRVAWASLFCLLDDNGETCGGRATTAATAAAAAAAAAAEAVTAEPAFTG
jgi:hypothetical protein